MPFLSRSFCASRYGPHEQFAPPKAAAIGSILLSFGDRRLAREDREERGIEAAGGPFFYGYLFGSAFESEYARCWSLAWGGAVAPDPAEIKAVDALTLAQVDALVGKKTLTPLVEREWPLLRAALS